MTSKCFSGLYVLLTVIASVHVVRALAAAPLAQSPAAALLAQPATLRGMRGAEPIQMHLQPTVLEDEGIEGSYFLLGQAHKILLAGETENDILALEESDNCSDISGLWDGKINGRSVRGTWSSADGWVTKPFALVVTPSAALARKSRPAKETLTLVTRHAADQY